MYQSLLTTQALNTGYRKSRSEVIPVSAGLDLSLQRGELVCLIGPNGAGKTTLLRTLSGMLPPLSGTVTLGADALADLKQRELARRISVVLTEPVDVALLTAYELVALGRHPYTDWTGQLSDDDHAQVRDALAAVDAAEFAARPVKELSDGERQKIMIARALAQGTPLVILDEPTAYLDLPRRVEMLGLLRRLAHETQRGILLSTHDLDLALKTADRVWLMASDGTLRRGAPEDLVLDGSFEAVFHSEGVIFDPETGSFVLQREGDRGVSLAGNGLRATWTRRAIERAGWQIVPVSDVQITVYDEAWQLVTATGTQRLNSIHALVAALSALE